MATHQLVMVIGEVAKENTINKNIYIGCVVQHHSLHPVHALGGSETK